MSVPSTHRERRELDDREQQFLQIEIGLGKARRECIDLARVCSRFLGARGVAIELCRQAARGRVAAAYPLAQFGGSIERNHGGRLLESLESYDAAGGIDRHAILRLTPPSGSVEMLEAETHTVDVLMACLAGGIGAVERKALARRQVRVEAWWCVVDIRWRRGKILAEDASADEDATSYETAVFDSELDKVGSARL